MWQMRSEKATGKYHQLNAGHQSRGSPFYEFILVDGLGENRCWMLASPGLAEEMAVSDQIELGARRTAGLSNTQTRRKHFDPVFLARR